MRQATNQVKIEGILAETDLKYTSFKKNGEDVEAIGGKIKILVNQEVNKVPTALEVPVYMFSSKYTKKGTVNPSYTSIEKVMNEFVSIAAAGSEAQADRVRITNADIRMNVFPGRDGIVSEPRIHASFVSKAIGEFKPEATFTLEFMVSNIQRAVDKDGVELDPAKLNVEVIVPQYTAPGTTEPNVDVVNLTAVSPNVINAVESYWEAGACYTANGRLNFSSKTVEVSEDVDFGEPIKKIRTISVSEFIITGGTQAPLEGEFAFDIDEIKAGMAARKARLEDIKNGKKAENKQAPAQQTSKGKLDLGF